MPIASPKNKRAAREWCSSFYCQLITTLKLQYLEFRSAVFLVFRVRTRNSYFAFALALVYQAAFAITGGYHTAAFNTLAGHIVNGGFSTLTRKLHVVFSRRAAIGMRAQLNFHGRVILQYLHQFIQFLRSIRTDKPLVKVIVNILNLDSHTLLHLLQFNHRIEGRRSSFTNRRLGSSYCQILRIWFTGFFRSLDAVICIWFESEITFAVFTGYTRLFFTGGKILYLHLGRFKRVAGSLIQHCNFQVNATLGNHRYLHQFRFLLH